MWQIQNNIFGDEQEKLILALENNNIKYEILDSLYKTKAGQFARGSVEFVENQTVLKRLTIENYDYSNYSQYFYKDLLNYDFYITPWWNLENFIFSNQELYTEGIFIRPNSGRKIFTGTTLSPTWYWKEIDIIKNLPSSNIKNEDLVVVSSVKKIESEYRVLFYKDKFVAASYYNGDFDLDFMLRIATATKYDIPWFPDDLWVCDMARVGNNWKIVEINNGWSAGWYEMDHNYIVQYIKENII